MPIAVNFLSPTDLSQTKITKTFQQKTDGSIEKIADYGLGYHFYHTQEVLPEAETLKHLAALLQKYSKTHFRIYGQPVPGLPSNVRRITKNFPPDPAGYHLAHVDADGWPVDDDTMIATGWDLTPTTTEQVVRSLLAQQGLAWLAAVDLVVVLSSSQMDVSRLNAHIYFIFDKPVNLDYMRAVAISTNKGANHKILDPQVYRAVQPDYISAPVCDNFVDPIPQRIMYFPSPYGLERVDEKSWERHCLRVEKNVGQSIKVESITAQMGQDWQGTLQTRAGTAADGINQPCYLAAAQMIKSIGQSEVSTNLEKYALLLHNTAWTAIDDKGLRGDSTDRQAYGLNKFRSYLSSAINKGYGGEEDRYYKLLEDAIEEAQKPDTRFDLLGSTALNAFNMLIKGAPIRAAKLRKRIKKTLFGTMSINKWEKMSRNIGAAELISTAMLPGKGDNTNPIAHLLNGDGQAADRITLENRYFMSKFSNHTFLESPDAEIYVLENGGVLVNDVTSSLIPEMQNNALEVFEGKISSDFGRRAFSYLIGGLSVGSIELKKGIPVGSRTLVEGYNISSPFWINLGEPEDKNGKHECLKVTPAKVERLPIEKGKVFWKKGMPLMPVLTSEQVISQYGTYDMLIEHYMSRIGYYISTSQDFRGDLTTWAVSALTCRPLAYMIELLGPKSSGKSSAAAFIGDLVHGTRDKIGSGREVGTFTGFGKDFYGVIHAEPLTIMDNIGTLKTNAQDMLCRILTGVSFKQRKLYTDNQILKLFVKRPIISTAIESAVTREDLSSRTLTINMKPINRMNSSLADAWTEEVPAFRAAIIEIARRVMLEAQKFPQVIENVAPRDVVGGLVYNIIYPQRSLTLQDFSQTKQEQKSVDAMLSNTPLLLFLAFMQNGMTDGDSLVPATILQMMSDWTIQNFSKTIDVYIHLPNEVHSIPIRVENSVHLDSPRKIGILLSRSYDTLNRLSGWMISEQNSSRLRKRKFTKKVNLKDII